MNEEELFSMFEECEVKLSICPEGGEKESFAFRAYVLNDLGEVARNAVEALADLAFDAEDENEVEWYSWVMKMLSFYDAIPELDPQRERSFDPATLNHEESLQELVRYSGSVTKPVGEKLESLTGDVKDSIPELFADAIYENPRIEIGLLPDEYREFRDGLLDEWLNVRANLDNDCKNTLTEICKTELSKPGLTGEEREYYEEIFAQLEKDELPEKFVEINENLECEIIRNAVQMEEEKMSRFRHLVEAAEELLNKVWDEIDWGEDESTLPDDYEIQLDSALHFLDEKLANDLLDNTCEEYRVSYPSCAGDERLNEGWEEAYASQFEMFREARESSDTRIKFDVIYWISINLVNRNSMVSLMLREAESVQLEVLSWYFKNVYRTIRHKLNYFERRVFKLMYWRWPFTGERIAALDSLAQGFLSSMDDDTKALVCLSLIYKRQIVDGYNIRDIVEKRWKSYLRFYPSWVEITQHDEREKKRKRSRFNKKASSFELENIPTKKPCNKDEPIKYSGIEFHPSAVLALLSKLNTGQQRVMKSRFFDEKSQEQIAAEEGISQQAVSKRIVAGIKKLKEAIEERKESAA